ncbi:hypothetical protein PSYJA_26745 [Pseudomonas syringae pv. japonica str. M301072]|uniref:Uncharacterized protein n=1 Tax=Pseudomonas syringae pv. japonica str. M301072 TaxID=629262 RepID=F3FQ70_PSESX|nr:hypothetical protein PSYJA_26745 [Pseudomonas syringae pv. japonica str. M301072]
MIARVTGPGSRQCAAVAILVLAQVVDDQAQVSLGRFAAVLGWRCMSNASDREGQQ